MSVSAVLLTFNRREMTARVLDELHAQGCADEVIVVDASSDGTAEMARARGAHRRSSPATSAPPAATSARSKPPTTSSSSSTTTPTRSPER